METVMTIRSYNDATDAIKEHGHFSLVPNCLLKLDIPMQAKLLWMYFNSQASTYHPRFSQIESELKISRQSIVKYVGLLEELNMLKKEKSHSKGRKVNIYHITHPSLWNSEEARKQYPPPKDKFPTEPIDQVDQFPTEPQKPTTVPYGTDTSSLRNRPNERNRSEPQDRKESGGMPTPYKTMHKTINNYNTSREERGAQPTPKKKGDFTASVRLLRFIYDFHIADPVKGFRQRVSREAIEHTVSNLLSKYGTRGRQALEGFEAWCKDQGYLTEGGKTIAWRPCAIEDYCEEWMVRGEQTWAYT